MLTPPYRIETERLVIRCWDPADADSTRRSLPASITCGRGCPGSQTRRAPWISASGFLEEATFRRRLPSSDGGERRDATMFSPLGEELSASPSARAPLRAYNAAGRPVELGASGTPAAG